MSWAESVRETALAALAGQTTTAARTFASAPARWTPPEVWLKRALQPREREADRSLRDPAAPHRHAAAPCD